MIPTVPSLALATATVLLLTLPAPLAHAGDTGPLFVPAEPALPARHHETEFNDSERQPLIPRRLSQNGPGVSWSDINGDGQADLLLPDAKGGVLQVWLGDATGGFHPAKPPSLSTPAPGDLTTALHWSTEPGHGLLVLGTSGYESDSPSAQSVAVFPVSPEGIQPAIPLSAGIHIGAIAAADIDLDHDLDLFIAGQCVPGRYPEATPSKVFRHESGGWVEDATNGARLAGVGLVNGAVWTDIDGDGDADLVLACEWGPVRLFRNHRGLLEDVTAAHGLTEWPGWWNSIAAADVDGDGRMDLIAGNWGRNTRHERTRHQGLTLYHGDIDGSGTWECIETYLDPDTGKEVPWRDYPTMGRAIPSVAERFASYEAYANASIQEILGEPLKRAKRLQARTLESMVFLNRGDHFEGHPLPLQAQFAPVFGVTTADFDGDGQIDVFLAQNFFASDRETGRYDAGQGLLLRGDGRGHFKPMGRNESGLQILGEQRGSAAADYDGDGRIDLVVTQNAGPVRLYRNQRAAPGLRVKLQGHPGNLSGIGAQLRLMNGAKHGPMHELRAGGGWWSQDSAILVLPNPNPADRVWIRWPGESPKEWPLPAKAHEIEVDVRHGVRVLR